MPSLGPRIVRKISGWMRCTDRKMVRIPVTDDAQTGVTMRFLPATAVGVVASALVLAACEGPQASTAPNETPSFSRISAQTQYTATLTCNAAASRSYANITFQGVLGTSLFCNPTAGNQVTVTSFSEFTWGIILQDNTGYVKSCPRNGDGFSRSTRTGQFSCKDAKTGLSVVLTVEPS